jgi:hypothetical protein
MSSFDDLIGQADAPNLDEAVRLLHDFYPSPDLVRGRVAVPYRDLRNRIGPAESVVDRE